MLQSDPGLVYFGVYLDVFAKEEILFGDECIDECPFDEESCKEQLQIVATIITHLEDQRVCELLLGIYTHFA